ncbi:MAG: SWIM zinc finger domain-containing protein [Actinomycetota bacterium]|nr:SWIM zinc finger domain-containing protein [Actinomycetota bacterium]
MTTTRIAQPAHPSTPETTREQRGLQLYREHADEIRYDAQERVWLVPSQSAGTSVYEVTIGPRGEFCECRDFEFRGLGCKHITAATIARAKSARCASCGGRFPRRELVEVGPEQAEHSLDASEGERLCRPCAARVGVL